MKVKRKGRRSGDDEIPVSSFSDIAFLLIIFFILTTTLQKPEAFLSEIPAGKKGQEQQQEEKPTIALNDDEIRFNDDVVSMEQLRNELLNLELADRDEEGKIVLVEATGAVKYQTYFETLSMISGAGGLVAIVRENK